METTTKKFFTKELSLLEMNWRVVLVWVIWHISVWAGKIKNPTRVFKIAQTWLEIQGINSLCLLHENQEQRDAWKTEWHLRLDELKGQLCELRGH